jgi:ubiquitin-like 1-activating enzyme E1 A
MTDLTAATDPKAMNGTAPADDAAGQTLAAIAESEKISAGRDWPE